MAEPMKPAKIKIVIGAYGRSKESGVYLDGVKIPYTYNIEFAAPVNDMPTLHIDMYAAEVEIECDDAEITLGIQEFREMAAIERKRRVAEQETKPAEVSPVRFREFT